MSSDVTPIQSVKYETWCDPHTKCQIWVLMWPSYKVSNMSSDVTLIQSVKYEPWCDPHTKCQIWALLWPSPKKERYKKPLTLISFIFSEWNLSKLNLLGISFCIQNRQVFTLYRLNLQRFPTLELYLLFSLYSISFYSGFGLDSIHCTSLHTSRT